ncbi:ferredoxin--NADP reductase [Adhaeribacter sp. BT258]|uniref:Ferredoxin--NADP reductase n=1 Tax=Adhaeribacter terrigena TaxID=2793070 RepID=A0ABS1BZF1_9BACT|nr:ferredoxin--NADP reductase [Adhaeribacter terrigena]MBK0402464.1 ferredoxin--NADP reductase [Adhaeribacter terrigena]
MNASAPENNDLFKTLTITAIKTEAPDVKTFYFEGPDASSIAYQAGQYLTFLLPHHQPEVRRSYSIISASVLNEPLAIGVKRMENGIFSRYLIDQVRVGDQLITTGAAGFFTLPENLDQYKQLFFLAAGSGITPIFSLIKTVLFAYPKLPVVLIYSNKTHDHAIFREELVQLADQFPQRFKVEFLFSNAADLAKARLYKGLLQTFVKVLAVAPPAEILAYVCGPENYMRMCTYGLHVAGVRLENIRKENFSTRKVPMKVEPPDTDPHLVTLKFKNQEFRFESRFPDTILQAAKKAGLSLPYSCEAGKCGNCAARCTAGQTWMSYNEVLTEKETAAGLTLTCTAYPVGGNVTLEI